MSARMAGRVLGRLVPRHGSLLPRHGPRRLSSTPQPPEGGWERVGEGRGAYKAQRLEALGTPSYPHQFNPTMQIPAFLHAYSAVEGEEAGQEEVAVAGMVVGVREAGRHLRFVDLEGQGARLQLKVDSRRCEGQAALLRRGDRVGDLLSSSEKI